MAGLMGLTAACGGMGTAADLSISPNKLRDVAVAARELAATASPTKPPSTHLLAAGCRRPPANTEWRRGVSAIRQKIGGLGNGTEES